MADVTTDRRQLKVDVDKVVDRALRIDAALRGIPMRQFVEDALRAHIAPGAMKQAKQILDSETGRAA